MSRPPAMGVPAWLAQHWAGTHRHAGYQSFRGCRLLAGRIKVAPASSQPAGGACVDGAFRWPEAAGAAVADLSKRTRLVSGCAAGASLSAECFHGVGRRRCRRELEL
jgi:hypothetical protein